MSGHIHPGTIPEEQGVVEEVELSPPAQPESRDTFDAKAISEAHPGQLETTMEGRYKTLEFTSENAGLGMDISDINVKYCALCAVPLFICDAPWEVLPRRDLDGSYVFETSRWKKNFLITPTQKGPAVIKREKGAEVQYRFMCSECDVAVGYTSELLSTDDRKTEPSFYYVFAESFVQKPQQSDFAKAT